MKKIKTTIAKRVTRIVSVWLCIITLVLSYFVYNNISQATRHYFADSYRNRMLVTYEYTRRVTSDVYVSVTNNIYYLEHSLERPDSHKEVMERIVRSGTRVTCSSISFIEDYYPQKGHRLCSFAWRNPTQPDVIRTEDLCDAGMNYLDDDWFNSIIKSDSAKWSAPYYEGFFETKPVASYMVPIHDGEGRPVAVLSADISLDWLTNKLIESDSTTNVYAPSVLIQKNKPVNYIIKQDGTFITHEDSKRILKDNFYNCLEACDGSDVKGLTEAMKKGIMGKSEGSEKFIFEGKECYVFYAPVKYTDWLIVSVAPSRAVEMAGFFHSLPYLGFIIGAMLALLLVCYFCIKRATAPLQQLAAAADDMTDNKFHSPLPDTNQRDEIYQMRDAFEKLQYSLSHHFNEMKAANKGAKTEQ